MLGPRGLRLKPQKLPFLLLQKFFYAVLLRAHAKRPGSTPDSGKNAESFFSVTSERTLTPPTTQIQEKTKTKAQRLSFKNTRYPRSKLRGTLARSEPPPFKTYQIATEWENMLSL